MDQQLKNWIKNNGTAIWENLGKPNTMEEFEKKLSEYYFGYSESVFWDIEKIKRKTYEDGLRLRFDYIYQLARKKVVDDKHIFIMRQLGIAKQYKNNVHSKVNIDYFSENSKEREAFILCTEKKYNSHNIFEACSNNMDLYKEVRKNAKNYCIKIVGLTDKEYKLYIHSFERYYKDIYQEAIIPLYEILNSKDIKEIIKNVKDINKIFKRDRINQYSYIGLIKSFSNNHPHPNSDEVSNVLNFKIKKAYYMIDKTKQENKLIEKEKRKKELEVQKEINEKELFEKAKEVINNFLDSGLLKKEYCEIFAINQYIFEKYVDIIKKHAVNLYERYEKHIENRLAKGYKLILIKLKQIIDYIKNGISINEIDKRHFDLIDYYMITKIDLEDMKKIAKKSKDFNENDLKLFYTFAAQNSKNFIKGPQAINSYYNTKISIGERELLLEEKQNLVNYLKIHNIPINQKTITLVQKRYLNGQLNIEPSLTDESKKF